MTGGRAAHWTVDVAIVYIGMLFLSGFCGCLIGMALIVDRRVVIFSAMVLLDVSVWKHLIYVTIAVTCDGSSCKLVLISSAQDG